MRGVTLCKKYEITTIDIHGQAKESWTALNALATAQGLDENNLWKLFSKGWNDEHIESYLKTFDLMNYLRDRYQLVMLGNKRVDQTKPREIAKTDVDQAKRDLQVLLFLIKGTALLSSPFLIDGFDRFRELVQIQNEEWIHFTTQKSSENI